MTLKQIKDTQNNKRNGILYRRWSEKSYFSWAVFMTISIFIINYFSVQNHLFRPEIILSIQFMRFRDVFDLLGLSNLKATIS